jgi:hypothetical protein
MKLKTIKMGADDTHSTACSTQGKTYGIHGKAHSTHGRNLYKALVRKPAPKRPLGGREKKMQRD